MVGRKNVYICQTCRYAAVTVHRDDGVAPFMIPCISRTSCKGLAQSTFYQVHTDLEPIGEWYYPAKEELAGKDEATKQHVKNGGLLLRPIQTSAEKKKLGQAVRASLLK